MAIAIESILAQTLRDFELILVDDGSTNSQVADIAREFEKQDSRVQFFQKENGGAADARNFGVEKSTAPILAFQDDDDISEPERLQTQVYFLQQHPDVAATVCGMTLIDVASGLVSSPKIKTGVCLCRDASAVIRREAFLAIGGYRSWFRAAEDRDFGFRFAERKYVAVRIPQRLYHRRKQDPQLAVSSNIQAWRFACAAEYSAYCRKAGKPDPVGVGATLDEVMMQAAGNDFAIRAICLRRVRGPAKHLLLSGHYAAVREIFLEAKTLFGGDKAGKRYYNKLRWQIMWIAIRYGKLLAFIAPAAARNKKS